MAKAVDHCGGQQHTDDAQDGHNGEDEELGGLSLAVLGGDLLDLASLQATKEEEIQKVLQHIPLLYSLTRHGTAKTKKKENTDRI